MPNSDPTFTILALGAFTPLGESGYSARLVPAETPSLEEAMAAFAPRLWIPVPVAICPDGGLTLAPGRMDDLLPDGLIQKTLYLKNLQDAAAWIENASAGGIPPETLAAQVRSNWPRLPLDLSLPASPEAISHSAVDDLLAMVAMPGGENRTNAGSGGPSSWKIQIDGLLAANLSCIFENPDFRTFEAAWRGAETVLRHGCAQGGQGTRMYLVSVSPPGLADALDALTDQLADTLPNLIVIDMPFDQSPWSLDRLDRVVGFAENLLAPAAVWITPAFLHLHGWDELHRLPLLKNHMEDAVYAKWRKLMARPDGCWLAATCNRFLTRFPYGNRHRPQFVYFEEKEPLWISPVWALAALAARSVGACGWPSRFADAGDIRLQDLAIHGLADAETAATEALISDERIRQLIEIGITSLAGTAGKDIAFMPQETTVAGESLRFQLFFSRMIGFLIYCRETFPAGPEDLNPEKQVYEALITLFRDTGHDPPFDLSVKAGAAEAGEPVPLAIAFSPPRQILPDSRQIAFTFSW